MQVGSRGGKGAMDDLASGLRGELADFGVELSRLRSTVGLHQVDLAKTLHRAPSWVSQIEAGKIPRRLDLSQVWAWIVACTPGTELTDPISDYWKQRYARVERILDLLAKVKPGSEGPTTWLARDWTALDLGVHRPIVVDTAHQSQSLPLYVERAHDDRLRGLLAEVVVEPRNVMVVLTGGSCTGKTRSAWEGPGVL
jgi:hypothetical protein